MHSTSSSIFHRNAAFAAAPAFVVHLHLSMALLMDGNGGIVLQIILWNIGIIRNRYRSLIIPRHIPLRNGVSVSCRDKLDAGRMVITIFEQTNWAHSFNYKPNRRFYPEDNTICKSGSGTFTTTKNWRHGLCLWWIEIQGVRAFLSSSSSTTSSYRER